MPHPVKIDHQGSITVLEFTQDLDAGVSPDIQEAVDNALIPETQSFVIDMNKVSFLDSHGVGVFAILLKRAHERGGHLAFCGLKDQPRSVLHMVGFETLAQYYDDTSSALTALDALP